MSSYPGVTVRILDESLVVSNQELNSPAVGAMLGGGGAHSMKLFAYDASELSQGFYYVENLPDWFTRLTNFYNTVYPGFSGTNGVTLAAVDLATNGATAWTDEWYHVHNFLQYGSPCYVSWADSGGSGDFYQQDFDIVFQGSTANSAQTFVNSVVNQRAAGPRPVFGVLGVNSSASPSSATVSSTYGENTCAVYGEKKHFNVAGEPSTLIISSLSPDVAGCISRTDRDSFPWFSPAGARRGRINNVAGLTKILSEADKASLYGNKINPVFNVPGEGTLLFGDKTLYTGTSTLSSINVARLFIYLKRVLGPLARGVLFEQNDANTRSAFVSAADSVLREVVAGRGISEYKIICDESNNTAEIIESKSFVADVLVKPIPSVNFVRLTLTNKDLSSTL
jgi:hypothetical protein